MVRKEVKPPDDPLAVCMNALLSTAQAQPSPP